MRSEYRDWLRSQHYDDGTITAQLHRVARVEAYLGDVDQHFDHDALRATLERLRYSTEDERRGRANPTQIPINGQLRTNLASYRNAVSLYARFRAGGAARPPAGPSAVEPIAERAPRRSPPSLAAQLATSSEHARTLAEFGFNGQAALASVIASSRYRTLAQAVASLALFSHPQTVAQTQGRPLFRTVRGTPGNYLTVAGQALMADDNKSPTDAFLWCNGINARGRDTQFNHIYAASLNVQAYTALPNVVMTPAFLAKLTDTDAEITALLAWRSYDLYGWRLPGAEPPTRPDTYATLEWAAPLPPVADVASAVETKMRGRPKDRTVIAARRLGWLFGPDFDGA